MATVSPTWARESMHLDEYLALIEHYRASDPADSAQGQSLLLEVPRWDIRETRRLADALSSLVQTERGEANAENEAAALAGPGATAVSPARAPSGGGTRAPEALDEGAKTLCAAALLHTEVATLELQSGRHAHAAAQRQLAWRLLQRLPESPAGRAYQRRWLLAVGALLRANGTLVGALQLYEEGLRSHPSDPALLLAAAAASEAVATLCFESDGAALVNAGCVAPSAEVGPERRLTWRSTRPPRPPNRKRLHRQTRVHLQRAVRSDPDNAEAHLRLGRALAQEGKDAEARRELQLVIAHPPDGQRAALAHLLLARMADDRRDLVDAVEHARAALTAAPETLAARLALARALLSRGDRRAAMETMAGLSSPGAQAEDLWLEFLFGSPRVYSEARDALYAEVRR